MGIDIRDMPADRALSLPDQFREAGLTVEVEQISRPAFPDVVFTQLRCRRGRDLQNLEWRTNTDKAGECRVYIANARGWRQSVKQRRTQLQEEVTAIVEANGGYWPFPDY